MKVVIRVGGAVVASPPSPRLLSQYAKLLKDLKEQRHELVVVVGGGTAARSLIETAKQMGLGEPEQDAVAISVTRLFAQLLALKLDGYAARGIPTSVDEAADLLREGGIVVMGGVKPGMTTDAVAAMIADRIGAELLVKATDQDGVYTKDPRKHPEARKLDTLSFDELSRLLEEGKHKAGIHQVFDPEAVRILQKRRTKTVVVNGFEPNNVALAIRGVKVGTLIR